MYVCYRCSFVSMYMDMRPAHLLSLLEWCVLAGAPRYMWTTK